MAIGPSDMIVKLRLGMTHALTGKMPLRSAITRLGLDKNDPAEMAIRQALLSQIKGSKSVEEQAAIDAAEAIRSEMLASKGSIMRMDHGTGAAATGSEARPASISALCQSSSKPPYWAALLFRLVRAMQPQHVLEMGTCLGISACYISGALKLNGKGHLLSLEGDPSSAEIASANLQKAGYGAISTIMTGPFSQTLGPALKLAENWDFVFIDGHHDGGATLDYFQKIRPFLKSGAILVFDDIKYSGSMARAWRSISSHKDMGLSVSLGLMGLCMYKPKTKRHKKLSFII